METAVFVLISEAARIVGVSQQTLKDWEKLGRLVPRRIAGMRVYERTELERVARAREDREASLHA